MGSPVPAPSTRVRCRSAASLSRHGCLVSAVYADTSGSGCCSLDGGRRIPNGSVASSGCAASTRPLLSRLWAAEPGTELKSPHTTMGISALAAIFSRPLSSVCTCHSLTSLSSVLAWMCVLATHSSWRLPWGVLTPGCSSASSTTISATLSFISRFRASFFWLAPPRLSTRLSAALLNSTSYFLMSVKRSFLKKIAHPSITYVPWLNTCAVFFLYTAV
mmetsp:Transcript_22538/g.55691  ORF Transcript_22538/g.55691 Transcript_22538/m.55691 type:complete len:218 (+) Transcript_22538:270-923(+)